MSQINYSETLGNGQIVKAGDQVSFIDSDGIERQGIVQYEAVGYKHQKHKIIMFSLVQPQCSGRHQTFFL